MCQEEHKPAAALEKLLASLQEPISIQTASFGPNRRPISCLEAPINVRLSPGVDSRRRKRERKKKIIKKPPKGGTKSLPSLSGNICRHRESILSRKTETKAQDLIRTLFSWANCMLHPSADSRLCRPRGTVGYTQHTHSIRNRVRRRQKAKATAIHHYGPTSSIKRIFRQVDDTLDRIKSIERCKIFKHLT